MTHFIHLEILSFKQYSLIMLTNNDLVQIKSLLIPLEKDVKDIKKRVRKTEKTVDVMIDQLDKEIVGTQKRVTKIEEHLRL